MEPLFQYNEAMLATWSHCFSTMRLCWRHGAIVSVQRGYVGDMEPLFQYNEAMLATWSHCSPANVPCR
ncbi:MAG: hypothetical protein QM800_00425 [Paludibacter sp.]